MKKKSTQAIATNKDLTIDNVEVKKMIEEADYEYYDFSPTSISRIAQESDIKNIGNHDLKSLVQALFPDALICSGLFDGIVLFSVCGGKRIDPPKHWYCDFASYLDNDNNAKVNRLKDEIKDLFEKNNIKPSDEWKRYFETNGEEK